MELVMILHLLKIETLGMTRLEGAFKNLINDR